MHDTKRYVFKFLQTTMHQETTDYRYISEHWNALVCGNNHVLSELQISVHKKEIHLFTSCRISQFRPPCYTNPLQLTTRKLRLNSCQLSANELTLVHGAVLPSGQLSLLLATTNQK